MSEKTYRVWFNQINQTYVDVKAKDAEEAKEKAYLKWRREWAHAEVSYVALEPK